MTPPPTITPRRSPCPACSEPLVGRPAFCPKCGARISPTPLPNETIAVAGPTSADPDPKAPSSVPGGLTPAQPAAVPVTRAASDRPGRERRGQERRGQERRVNARFSNGDVFDGRYRIVDHIGRGGMGEVYRADDLRIGESVALKLLPEELATDPANFERILAEVRIARQVTHPNVCRVFDLGEAGGIPYISMEYIDGENLGSLLQRIGRFPGDRGIELARELCAGLAAAHDRGVLHRDLKPANIMVDGRGKVAIADFGIAAAADEATDEVAGTPAYMAPELFEGEAASVQSDIYSLGLVLYEIFTGDQAVSGRSFEEIRRGHTSVDRPNPSTRVDSIDPAMERLILRCLERDPADRPPSVTAVFAALPGSDPLADALAAGETPSPALVAAAGRSCATLSRGWRVALLAAVVLGLAVVAWSDRHATITETVAPELPPEVLRHRAREVLTRLQGPSWTDRTQDEGYGFVQPRELLDAVEEHDPRPERWNRVLTTASGALRFWYRASPEPLMPRNRWARVREDDPPASPGSASVTLDVDGTLRGFEIDAPSVTASRDRTDPVDWRPILALAKFDLDRLQPTTPTRTPTVASDDRLAWTGPHPTLPDVSVRIEAATYQGEPVSLAMSHRFDVPRLEQFPDRRDRAGAISEWAATLMLLVGIAGGLWLGVRNLRQRNSDRAGAHRLALTVLALGSTCWLLRTSYVADVDLTISGFARIVFDAALLWLLYLALEPTIRRRRPRNLVPWTRLLAGQWRDPVVGLDLLVGVGAGVGIAVLEAIHFHGATWLGSTPPRPLSLNVDALHSSRHVVALLLEMANFAIYTALLATFLFILFRLGLRRMWVAVVLFLLVGTARIPWPVISDFVWLDLAMQLVVVGLIVFVFLRFGLLALVATVFTMTALLEIPLSLRTDAWYFPSSLWVIGVLLAVALLGSIGCRKTSTDDRY